MNKGIETKVEAIFTGKSVPLPPGGQPSAIAKDEVLSPVWLSESGLDGDEQADRRQHGGTERALCVYPEANYRYWRQTYPRRSDSFRPGAFGENLTTRGWCERQIHIGDVLVIGEQALVQVSQPRRPCWKLNHHMELGNLSTKMECAGLTGWFCRVLQAGLIKQGDTIQRLEIHPTRLSVFDLWQLLFDDSVAPERLETLSSLDVLAPIWRLSLKQRAAWLLRR